VPVDVVPLEPIEPVEPDPAVVPVLDVLPEPVVVPDPEIVPEPEVVEPELDGLAETGVWLHTSVTRSPEFTLFKRAAALLDTGKTMGDAGAVDDALPATAGCRTVTVIPEGSTATTSAATRWPLLWVDVAEVLLWPLVLVCATTRPAVRTKERIVMGIFMVVGSPASEIRTTVD
jgi:hypothetical protein